MKKETKFEREQQLVTDLQTSISQIDEQAEFIADVSKDELEWAYEHGAETLEAALQLIADDKNE